MWRLVGLTASLCLSAAAVAKPQQSADIAKLIRQSLSDAARVAQDIPNLEGQAVTLAGIASQQVRQGLREDGTQSFAKSVQAAQRLPAADRNAVELRVRVLFEIALQHALAGDEEGAKRAMALVEREPLQLHKLEGSVAHQRDSIFYFLVQHQVKAGRFDQAQATMGAMVNQERRDSAWALFAYEHVEFKDWKKATAVLEKIPGPATSVSTLLYLVEKQHQAGRAAEARTALADARAAFAKLDQSSSYLIPRLAKAYIESGDLPEAMRLAEKIPGEELGGLRDGALAEIHVAARDFPKALNHARKARNAKFPSEYAFRLVAQGQAAARQYEEARRTIEKMLDNHFKAQAYVDLARALHQDKKDAAAAEPLRLAVQLAEREPARDDQYFFSSPLQHFVAAAQAELGDEAAARQWVTRQISAHAQAWGLIGIAEGLHRRAQNAIKK